MSGDLRPQTLGLAIVKHHRRVVELARHAKRQLLAADYGIVDNGSSIQRTIRDSRRPSSDDIAYFDLRNRLQGISGVIAD